MAGTPTRTQSQAQAPHPTPSTRNNTTESGTAESGTTRTGTARTGTARTGTAESGTAESGTARTGTAESGTTESGTTRNNTAESGTAESGTARTGTAESGTAESGTAESGTAESGTARTGTAAAAAAAAPAAAQATAGRSRWRELAAASPLDASLLQVHVHGELHRLGHTVTGPLSAAVAQHYDDLGPAWDSQPVQRRATALAHLIATGTNPFPASRWQELTAHDPDRASRLRVLAAVELHRAQHPGMSRKTETFAHAYDHLADHWHTQPLADQATALAHKILTGTDLPLGTAPGAPGRTRAADDRDAADRLERTVRAELAALGHPAHDLPPAPKLVRDYPLDPAWHTMSPGHQAEAVARWIHTGLPPGPPTQTPTAPTQPATASTPTPPATQTPTRTPTPAPGSTPPATETPTRTGTAGSPGTAPAHQDDRFLIEEVRREFRYLAPHPTKDLPTADAIREADRNLPKQPWPVTQRERGQHLAQILLTGEKTRLLGGADNTTTRPPTPAPAPGPALADATAPALTSEQREIYDKLHPALAPYLVRPAPDELGSSAVAVHALLQDRHPDSSLTQHAQRILLPLAEQKRDIRLASFQDYGVRVDQAISDRELRILHGEMGGTYPELASYLTRADTSRTTDANTPHRQYTVTRLPIAGTTLTLHHDPTEAPDAHAERVRLLQRAVHLVQQRGFTVPDLEVHLPKYTRDLTVAADRAIHEDTSWVNAAEFFAPNILLVASDLPALHRSAPDREGVFAAYPYRIGEQAVAILVHELGHVLHHLHAPAKDLDATWADFQDAAAELAGTVSKYAGKRPGEFVAEVFAGLVFGRAFTDEQANMYEALGGPTPHMNDISHLATPPDLGRLTDEVNTQLTRHRQPQAGQETVRTHYNQLTGDLKWAHHDHQASAITQAILHITTRTGTGAPTDGTHPHNTRQELPQAEPHTAHSTRNPTPDQRQPIHRPFEQYLLALDTWRADHSTAIPQPDEAVHIRGADGRERPVLIGQWLAYLQYMGLVQPGGSLLAGALKARGIPTKEENGLLRRTTEAGPVVPVWSVEVYLRGLATWRAAAPAGEDRSTAIPPDGTYITLTDPTPTPLTDTSDTSREHNATDNAATTNGADIPIGTWLFQARHQGLTGLTDHEITQLQAAGLHAAEPHPDDTTRRRRLYWDHPGTTTPTHTTSPRHTGTSHQPDTHQHPTHPTPPTTTTTPAPPSRKRPRPADDAQPGEQERPSKRGRGEPAAPAAARPQPGGTDQTTPQGHTTTTAAAGQDRPAPPAPHAQPAPGLPATQPETGTSTRPAPHVNPAQTSYPAHPANSMQDGQDRRDGGDSWNWDGRDAGDLRDEPGMGRMLPGVPQYVSDQAATRHLTVYPVPADGDCFFHALIAARDMQAPDGPPANTTDVRAALAETLQQQLRLHPQHPHLAPWMPAARTQVLTALADHAAHQAGHTQGTDAFTQYTNEFSQAHAETRPDQQDWQHVITSLLTPGQWDTVAGDLAPTLAAHHYNIRLHTLHIHPGHTPWTLTFGPENAPEHHLVRTTGNGPEHWMPAHPTTTAPALADATAPDPALTPTPTPALADATTPALADATTPHNNQPATHPTPPHTTTNTAHTTTNATHHETHTKTRPTRTPRQGQPGRPRPLIERYIQALEQWREEPEPNQDRSRLLPRRGDSVLLRGPGAEVVHVHIGDWVHNLQHKGRDLAEGEAARLRNLGYNLEKAKAGEVNRGGITLTHYKLKPTPEQRQNIHRPVEQYLQALDTWRAAHVKHKTGIPPFRDSAHVRGVDGRERPVPIGNWLSNLQQKGLKKWDSLLPDALRARGIPTKEENGHLWRTTGPGPVVPVWSVEVYLRGLATWRAAAPAGEDRSTAIPPDGTYITLTDPTPTPLTDTSNTDREHNATDNATTSGADIPIGTWLFQARHQGLTGLTDHEITQLQAAGLHAAEPHPDDTTRRRRLYWNHPGTTTPTHTTSPRHTGTSHQPDTHQHPTHPTPHTPGTSLTPIPASLFTQAGTLLRPPLLLGTDPETQNRRDAVHHALTQIAHTLHTHGEDAARTLADTLATQNPDLRTPQPHLPGGTRHPHNPHPTTPTHTDTDEDLFGDPTTPNPTSFLALPEPSTSLTLPGTRTAPTPHTHHHTPGNHSSSEEQQHEETGQDQENVLPTTRPTPFDVDAHITPPTHHALTALGHLAKYPWRNTPLPSVTPWTRTGLPPLSTDDITSLFQLLDHPDNHNATLGGVLDHLRTTHHLDHIDDPTLTQELHRIHSQYHLQKTARLRIPFVKEPHSRKPPSPEKVEDAIRKFLVPTVNGTRVTDSKPFGTRPSSDSRDRGFVTDEGFNLARWLYRAGQEAGVRVSPGVRQALQESGFTVTDLPDDKVKLHFKGESRSRRPASQEEVEAAIRKFLVPAVNGERVTDSKPFGTKPSSDSKNRRFVTDDGFNLAWWIHHSSRKGVMRVSDGVRQALKDSGITVTDLTGTNKVKLIFKEKEGAASGGASGGAADGERGMPAVSAAARGVIAGAGQESGPEPPAQPRTQRGGQPGQTAGQPPSKPVPTATGRARDGEHPPVPDGTDPDHPRTLTMPGSTAPGERAGASDRPAEPTNARAAQVPAESGDRPEPGMPHPWADPDTPTRPHPATAASPDTFFPLLQDPGRALGSESAHPGATSNPPAAPTHLENQPDQPTPPTPPAPPGLPHELAQLFELHGTAQWPDFDQPAPPGLPDELALPGLPDELAQLFGLHGTARWPGFDQPAGPVPAAGLPVPGVAGSWAGPGQEVDPFSVADSGWPASGMGDAPAGPGVEGPGGAVPAGMFDPLALGDPSLPGEPLTAAAAADPLAWLDGLDRPDWPDGPDWLDWRGYSGESFLPGTAGTGGAAPHADRVGPDRPEDTGPAASTGTGVVPMTDEPVQDLPDGQWWNPAEQERQQRSIWAMARVDSSVQQAAHDHGWTVWQVPADGDCFFHALIAAGQAAGHTHLPESVTVIRAQLAAEVDRVHDTLLRTGALPPQQQDDQEPWWLTVQPTIINIQARQAALAWLRTHPDPGQDTNTRPPQPIEEPDQNQYFQNLVHSFTTLRANGALPQDWQNIAEQFRTPRHWNNVSGDIAPVIAAHLYGIHLHTLHIDPHGTTWPLTFGPTHGQPLHLIRHAHHWMPARHHTPTSPQPAPTQPHPTTGPPLPHQNPKPNQRQRRGQQAKKTQQGRTERRNFRTQWTDELILAAIDAWRDTECPDEENCTKIPPHAAKVSVRIPNTDRYEEFPIGEKIHTLIIAGAKSASPYLIEGLENRHLHMEEVDGFHRMVRQAGQRHRHAWPIEQFVAGLVHWRSIADRNGEGRSNALPKQSDEVVLAVPGSDTPSTVPIGKILYHILRGKRKLTEADVALLRQHGIHLSEPDNDGRRRVLQNPAPTASGSGTGPDQEPQPRHTRQDGTDAGPPPQPHSLPRRRRRTPTSPPPVRKRPRPTPAGTPRHSVPQGAPTPQPAQQPAAETSRPGITTPEQEQQQDPARGAATWPGEHADEAAGQDPEGLGDKPAAHPATGPTHESEESTTRTAGPPPAGGPPPHTATRAAPAAGMPADAGTAGHQAMSVEDYILDQMRGRPRTAE
ncbi:hypothetical protein OHB41_50950 [Streptomyces sp. NBC_01571]|uniref:hypothetical protein n=1 Tax=Streptomyces sp. NBC_01571 TaxID=2975883 RepID=UPI00224EA61B|nr:hypothetical protein [Streptomyces sp. NBC_01571]MCX4581277.1 hypothetical protein [Streptomyces sp. NBC_01571]